MIHFFAFRVHGRVQPALLRKAPAPQGHGFHIDAQLHADLQIRAPGRGSQNQSAPQRHRNATCRGVP